MMCGPDMCALLPSSQAWTGATAFIEKQGLQLKKAYKFKERRGGINALRHGLKGFVDGGAAEQASFAATAPM